MAEICTQVDSLGTLICPSNLVGNNTVVGGEQSMFVFDEQTLTRCSSGGDTSSDEDIDSLLSQIDVLQLGITSAENYLEENLDTYNEINSAVSSVNELISSWSSASSWIESQIQSYTEKYETREIDEETYRYWLESYGSQLQYVSSVVEDIIEENNYNSLVAERNALYPLVSEAFYTLYYFNNNPTNSMLIEDIQSQIDDLEVVSEPIEVDLRCVLDDSDTPITVFGLRGIKEGDGLMLDVAYLGNSYGVQFMVGEIEPTLIEIEGEDVELDVLHGYFGNDTNLFDYLAKEIIPLANMPFDVATKELVTIKLIS